MPPLLSLAHHWVDTRARRGELSGRSVEVNRTRLALLCAMYPDPKELDRLAVLEWQACIGMLAPATRRAMVGTVGRFLRWLQEEGHLEVDLSIHLVKVREPRRAPRALSGTDVNRILAATHTDRGRAIVTLMVQLGLRCVEVSRLDLDDYDRDSRTLFVRGKADHERVLPLSAEAVTALEVYLSARGYRPGPLFLAVGSKRSSDGRLSAKWLSKRIGKLMRDAGVHREGDRKTAHALRHTAASDVLDRCHDVRTVQQMLGHASLQSTEIYLRRADLGRLREAMEGRSYNTAS